MEDAITRHYRKLKEIENQKKLERADFNWRIQAEQDLVKKEKEERRQMNFQLQQSLVEQMAARRNKE